MQYNGTKPSEVYPNLNFRTVVVNGWYICGFRPAYSREEVVIRPFSTSSPYIDYANAVDMNEPRLIVQRGTKDTRAIYWE